MIYSPSKFFTRKFLKYLRENNYISMEGVEYSLEEVDYMYFEKCNELSERDSKLAYDKFINETYGCNAWS